MSSNHLNVSTFSASIAGNPATIALSLAVAFMATYVAIELVARVRSASDAFSRAMWLVAGAMAMGTGLWSMHFVGMSAGDYPFAARFGQGYTALSWLVAVIVSAAALFIAALERLTPAIIVVGGVAAGLGATFMHAVGMGALDVTPAMAVDDTAMVAGALVACTGAALFLLMMRALRHRQGAAHLRLHITATAVLGLSLTAMHYMAMSGIDFAAGTLCLSGDGLEVSSLGRVIGFASVVFLTLMLIVIALERRAEARARKLDGTLNTALRELDFITFNDPITGLPNRLVFQDRLQQAVARLDRSGRHLACLLVDLSGVGAAHDAQAGSVGARLLSAAAARMVGCVRSADTVASSSGSQFLILAGDLESARDAARIASKVLEQLAAPVTVDELSATFTVSIGVAVHPSDTDWTLLPANAATAMVAARSSGGNRYAFFEAAMEAEARQRQQWLKELRTAIDEGQFELHYQPKIESCSGRAEGLEALLRWRHPDKGLVSPGIFIPLAEQFGLINELGRWVISEACRQLRAWSDSGLALRVAVNLSVHQLRDPRLADDIIDALSRHDVDPRQLICEITESAAMDDAVATSAVFGELEKAGVALSIDDFGTGYSSLSYLRKLPLRQLKIDRSFVCDVAENDDALSIVRGIIDLAHALRLEVVAEGVETAAQQDVLVRLGCDKLQGFLFAKPMQASDVDGWLRDRVTMADARPATDLQPA